MLELGPAGASRPPNIRSPWCQPGPSPKFRQAICLWNVQSTRSAQGAFYAACRQERRVRGVRSVHGGVRVARVRLRTRTIPRHFCLWVMLSGSLFTFL